jgi:putative ABC transport system permease protein
MFSNFIKTALRNIFRHKTYVIINIMGLAVGFACSLLIFMFVFNELTFDKFNEKYNRIYRLYLYGKMADSEFTGAWTSAPTAQAFMEEFPEVEAAIRMEGWDETVVRVDDRKFIENNIALADSLFFDIFSIKMLTGNPQKALNQPNTVVLTEDQALKFFGKADPIGQHIRIGIDTTLYTITGVMENLPENSHFDFDILISFLTHPRAKDDFWIANSFATYILLREGYQKKDLESKIPALIEKYVSPQIEKVFGMDLHAFTQSGNEYGIFMQPLSDIHLNPDIKGHFKQPNDRKYIYIFSAVALLIIVVAGINYMNLSTARSTIRSREVGMRKVVGSSQGLLIRQFITESILLTFISLVLAIVLVELLLPVFNNMLQTNLKVGYFSSWYVIPGMVVLALLVGFLSGSYPAWFLSSFIPVKVLYGKFKQGTSGIWVRSALVVVQFAISIILIMSSFVIYRQVKFMLNKDLGFDKEQLLVIRRTDALKKQLEIFKQELKKIPGVINAANSTSVPGHPNNNNGFQMEGRPPENTYLMWVNWIDYDYLQTYNITLTDGRHFSRDFSSDTSTMIINQEAVRRFGIKETSGTRFIQPGETMEKRTYFDVVGVVKDFHDQNLRVAIEPNVFMIKPGYWDWSGYLSIRLDKNNVKKTIGQIEKLWDGFTSDEPLQYFFMDKEFETFYKEERRTARIAVSFSILAIFIACLGLFGLTSFATEQRAREISLRKVLGSSVNSIILLFSKEFSILVLIATIPASAVSYYLMNKWLQNFTYHISVGVAELMLSILIVMLIAFLTVSYRTYRAALTNPAEILKYE